VHELRYGILQALPQAEPPHGGARRPRIEIYDMPAVRRSFVFVFVFVSFLSFWLAGVEHQFHVLCHTFFISRQFINAGRRPPCPSYPTTISYFLVIRT